MADIKEALRQAAIEIRDEHKLGANTAKRVGGMFLSLIDWAGNISNSDADFSDLKSKVDTFIESSDTDGIINKWKELEAFLSGQTQTSTLADLLSVKADKSTMAELQATLNNKLDIAFFKRLFGVLDADDNELPGNDMATVIDSLKLKFGTWTEEYLSVKGQRESSGGNTGDSTSLGGLNNVGSWADEIPTVDRIMVQLAGDTHWSSKNLSDIVGLDTTALQAYLDNHSYATQDWVTGRGYLTSAALTGYATQSWVTNQGYATQSALNTVSSKVDTFLEGTDTDGIINKWKELEAFLSGQTQSSTLADLLAVKADKNIEIKAGTGLTGGGTLSATRTLSLAATGIAGTYTKVTTDTYGRVTSGSSLAASDIPTLAIDKVSGLQSALNNKLDTAYFKRVFGVLDANDNELSGNDMTTVIASLKLKVGTWTEEYFSVKGKNPGSGGSVSLALSQLADVSLSSPGNGESLVYSSGLGKWINGASGLSKVTVKLGSVSYDSVDGTVYLPAYPTSLPASDVYSWAKQSSKPSYVFSEIGSKPTTLGGYGITDSMPRDDRGYGSIIPNNISYSCYGFGYTADGWPTNGSFISFGGLSNRYVTQIQGSYSESQSYLYYRTRNNDNGAWGSWYNILHSGNYASIIDNRYVLKTGDTVTGNLTVNGAFYATGLFGMNGQDFTIRGKRALVGAEDQLHINYAGDWSSIQSYGIWSNTDTINAPRFNATGTSRDNGFRWTDDIFGGGGDIARIYLTNPAGGESTELTLEVQNDADDVVNILTPSATGLWHNRNVVLDANNYSGYINGRSWEISAQHLLINGLTWNSNWNWSGQGGQPTWLWGSNDGTNMYVYKPSNFSVNYASSAGNANTLGGIDSSGFARLYPRQSLGFMNDYQEYVIGLVNLDNIGNAASGRLVLQRTNILYTPAFLDYNVGAAYSPSSAPYIMSGTVVCYGRYYEPVTFTYNGVHYGGIRLYVGNAQEQVLVEKTYGADPLLFTYYNHYDNSVLNSEIYNSISSSNRVATNGNLWASLVGNATSATQLQTTRSLWGQSFRGDGDVSGSMYNVNEIYMSNETNVRLRAGNNGFQVLTHAGAAQQTAVGGLLVSDTYNVTPGIGQIIAQGNIQAGLGGAGASLRVPSGASYNQKSIETRGDGSGIAPGIGFHQPGVVASTLYMDNSGHFHFGDNPGTGHEAVFANTYYAWGWFRSYNATGWYNESYGGGIYQEDTTWVRVYGGKSFHCANEIYAGVGIWTDGYLSGKGQNTSDGRLKTDIRKFDGTEIIKSLSPKSFRWNDTAKSLAAVFNTEEIQYGLIAQETKKVAPWLVVDDMFHDGYMGVRYEKLIPVMLACQIEHLSRTEILERKVAQLEKENNELNRRLYA